MNWFKRRQRKKWQLNWFRRKEGTSHESSLHENPVHVPSERFEQRVLRTERQAIHQVMRRVEGGRHRDGSWQQQAFEECAERLAQHDRGEITADQIVHDIVSAAAKRAIGEDVTVDVEGLPFFMRRATITGIRRSWQTYGDNVLRLDSAGKSVKGHAGTRREAISERVRHEVWRRDGAQCVDCGSRERLEFDHIIPVSKGGSGTARNIELRCESCNRKKGARV